MIEPRIYREKVLKSRVSAAKSRMEIKNEPSQKTLIILAAAKCHIFSIKFFVASEPRNNTQLYVGKQHSAKKTPRKMTNEPRLSASLQNRIITIQHTLTLHATQFDLIRFLHIMF